MTTIVFSNRVLPPVFRSVHGVYESTAIKTKDGRLKLITGFSFGKMGEIIRVGYIDPQKLTDPRELKAYHGQVLEVIELFENLQFWVKQQIREYERGGYKSVPEYCSFVLQQEYPILIHGKIKGAALKVELFGRDINEMVFSTTLNNPDLERIFLDKLAVIIDGFRNHLSDVDKNVTLEQLF